MSKRGEIFKNVSVGRKLRSNVFDLSHEKKLTANMADLVPIYLQECVPGDKFRGKTELVIRLAPMVFPVMHRINAYIHYFFVPNRLIWDNWQDFITGGRDGKNTNVPPKISITDANKQNFAPGSLADYLGIPVDTAVQIANGLNVSALPFRAYQLIYNEYYRDQTLMNEIYFDKGDNTVDTSLLSLRKRCWEKDYFTSALPFTQRGDDVLIPMDIQYKSPSKATFADGTPLGDGQVTVLGGQGDLAVAAVGATIDNIESLQSTINDLRTSISLQQWLEKNARAGARYVESILAHFHRRVPDYRLQRPEMIGGGKQTIMISEVLSNFESAETALGKMGGHGLSVGDQSGFKYTADEHGYILGILSTLPRTGYMNSIHRMFFKDSKFDWYFPEFAHLGEQPVFNKEIYPDWSTGTAYDEVFGYQSRYAEYKYIPDSVHGEFRTTLEDFHLARKFTALPQLNASFVEADPDTRIFAVQEEATQKLWIQLYNHIRAIRPMPVYGTPVL